MTCELFPVTTINKLEKLVVVVVVVSVEQIYHLVVSVIFKLISSTLKQKESIDGSVLTTHWAMRFTSGCCLSVLIVQESILTTKGRRPLS